MNVIKLPVSVRTESAPLMVFVDLQQEYVATGRAYSVNQTSDCLSNCARLLAAARQHRLPIAHFRQVRPDTYFNRESEFSQWIEDFRPKANESVYERSLFSCYENEGFSAFLEHTTDPLIVVAGLSGEQACLSTAIDAYHRRHRMIFVRDCCATSSLAGLSEETSHNAVCDVISRYAEVHTVDHLLGQLGSLVAVNFRKTQ